MLEIFIIEDTAELASLYEEHLNKQIFINDYTAEIALVSDASEPVIELVKKKNVQGGLYFLDIEIADIASNGIDLAMQIRKHDIDAEIVFLTSHDELVMTAIEAKVAMLDYIIKTKGLEQTKARITDDLAIAMTRYLQINKQRTGFVYSIGTKKFTAQIADVIYIESATLDHKLILHRVNEITELNGNLKDFDHEYSFLVRVHRSILVNRNHIESFDTKERTIRLDNGVELPASARLLKEFMKT